MKRLAVGFMAIVLAGCQVKTMYAPGESPPKPKPRPKSRLEQAIWQGKNDRLLAALRANPSGDIEDDGTTNLLQVAVQAHNDKAINILLLHGADPDGLRYSWDTPLALAVKENNLALVKRLLLFGANPSKATPLSAIHNDETGKRIAALLVSSGANIEGRSQYGRTLLVDAVSQGDWKVKLMLDLGANPDGADPSSESPLDAAFAQGKTPTVKLLKAYGSRRRRPQTEKENERDFEQVAKVLQQSGGRRGR